MPQTIDKQAVANSFSKAASHYDQFAQLQRDIGEVLLSKLTQSCEMHDVPCERIVDLGCGTGYFSEKLNRQFNNASLTCFDLSEVMLEQTKLRQLSDVTFQLGDIDAISFAENSVDVIYSNLVVQWSNNLQNCLTQVHKCLKAGGRAYISTLINGTLHELTEAWKSVDNNPHTNHFLSLKDIQFTVEQSNFHAVNITTETRILHYDNVIEVIRALKGIGANHVHGHKKSHISGRQLLKKLQVGYLPFTDQQRRLNLTYQVCYIEVIK